MTAVPGVSRGRGRAAGWLRALAIACAVLAPGAVRAQAVVGTTTDSVTGLPVRGAFVELLRADGRRLAGTLSDSTGRFIVARRDPEAVRIRVQAIGYADAGPLPLPPPPPPPGAGATRVAVQLQPKAVSLEGLTVEAKPRCALRGDPGMDVDGLWHEARKALTIVDWSGHQDLRLMVTSYERTSRMVSGDIISTRRSQDTISGGAAFHTIRPEEIAAKGLIQPAKDGSDLVFAPGPDYLLSDAFLDTHCFAARKERGRIALLFAPVDAKRYGDVTGTLWLDGKTFALQSLHFEITGSDYERRIDPTWGTLEYGRLPDGLWLIRKWAMRGPILNAWAKNAIVTDNAERRGKIVLLEKGGEVQALVGGGFLNPAPTDSSR